MGSKKVYLCLLIYAFTMLAAGFILSTPADIVNGIKTIIVSEDTLITDYFELAGPGAAFVNSGLVALISILLLYISRDPICGTTILTVGIMSGFAFFGKNIFNIWPIIFGTWIYALTQKESFMKYTPVALLATSLSPIVSFIALRPIHPAISFSLAVLAGLVIGFVMPPLAEHTFRIQNGMNLYNAGFAAGLVALVLVSFTRAFGAAPEAAYYWSTKYHYVLLIYLGVLILACIISAFFVNRYALKIYWKLLKFRGRMPNDYLERFGPAAVLLNTGLCGAIGVIFIVASGGVLNGPTAGAILTIMCFASNGKNPRNIIPIMLGVCVGSLLNEWEITAPAVQIAILFCTGLAPISDVFGIAAGLVAGFLHSSVVLYAGSPLAGLNLYNNGFAAGVVSIVLYPLLLKVLKHKRARITDMDYLDVFK